MKPLFAVMVVVASMLLVGCESPPPQRRIVLDAIGPVPGTPESNSTNGTLIVYSAYPTTATGQESTYRRYRTDYDIFTQDGVFIQAVQNRIGDRVWNEPKPVELAPGRYRVRARSTKYGFVIAPVVIAANRITVVQLGTGPGWEGPHYATMMRSNPVRLPDEAIAGWRAR